MFRVKNLGLRNSKELVCTCVCAGLCNLFDLYSLLISEVGHRCDASPYCVSNYTCVSVGRATPVFYMLFIFNALIENPDTFYINLCTVCVIFNLLYSCKECCSYCELRMQE